MALGRVPRALNRPCKSGGCLTSSEGRRCTIAAMSRLSLFIASSLALATFSTDAADKGEQPYWRSRADGWHFYERNPPPRKKPKPPMLLPAQPPAPSNTPAEPAVLSSAWLRDNLPRYRDAAIDNPTPENVELLAYLQRLATDRAEQFSQVWTRVVTSNPALDETARSPISALQQRAAQAEMSVAKKQAMAKIVERVGLWYFYLSTCPFCAKQEPILESVQANIGLSILPISLDGGAPPTWGDVAYLNNSGQAEELGVMVTPTLVVADTATGELHNLSAGLRTESEIESRLLELAAVNSWISEEEYERAVRGEPRRFLPDGLMQAGVGALPGDDPQQLLQTLRSAGVKGGGTSWIVNPQPSGDTR